MTLPGPGILYLYYRLVPHDLSEEIVFAGGAQKRTCQMAEHFSSLGWRVGVGSDDKPDTRVVQRLRSSGVVAQRFPFWSGWARVPTAIAMLAACIRRNRIDIVHCNDRRTAAFAWIAGRLTRCHIVYTARNTFLDKKLTRFFFGHNIVAVSQGVKENLCRDFHVPARRITVIHNGTDIQHSTEVERKRAAAAWGLSEQDRIIVVVGRLTRQKGLEYLVDAVQRIRNSFPCLRVLIVGEGEMKETLRSLVHTKGLAGNILLCGSHVSVAPFIDLSEFTVMPSLWEGLPGGAIESSALGKPVLASAVGGLPEVIEHGRNGLLVQPKDVGMLADTILLMLRNPEMVHEMGREAKRIVSERFTLSRMMSRYEKYYDSLLSNQVIRD